MYDGHSASVRKLIEGVYACPKISRVLELIGKIRRCCPMQTHAGLHENGKLELNPLRCLQRVQLAEERSDCGSTKRTRVARLS